MACYIVLFQTPAKYAYFCPGPKGSTGGMCETTLLVDTKYLILIAPVVCVCVFSVATSFYRLSRLNRQAQIYQKY